MPIYAARPNTLKILACLALAALLSCPAAGAAQPQSREQAAPQAPDYLIQPAEYRDSYILTQLFYSAFSVDDLGPMQQLVSQGLLAHPEGFPRFMALTLELLRTPDSRLFMLLSPVAPHLADASRPADLESAIRLTDILTGQRLPGGGIAEPSLKDRIKFYEDDSRVAHRAPESATDAEAAQPAQPPVPGRNQDAAEPPPAYIDGKGESLVFSRHPGNGAGPYTELIWTRPGPDQNSGQSVSSRALESALPDGSVWGGVYTDVSGRAGSDLAFFMVRDGIITFALPKDIDEGDFYADEKARPRQAEGLDPAAFAARPDGAAPRPCEMRVIISPLDDSMPPELSARLEQSNAEPGESDFICRPQCALSYSWGENGYYLSGKSCAQGGWGVWPRGAAPGGRP